MKKNQYGTLKFKTDNNPLSDTQIDKHKNFNKLMHEYQYATKPLYKTPLYKNKKVFLVILLIVLILFIIAENIVKEEKHPPVQNTQHSK